MRQRQGVQFQPEQVHNRFTASRVGRVDASGAMASERTCDGRVGWLLQRLLGLRMRLLSESARLIQHAELEELLGAGRASTASNADRRERQRIGRQSPPCFRH